MHPLFYYNESDSANNRTIVAVVLTSTILYQYNQINQSRMTNQEHTMRGKKESSCCSISPNRTNASCKVESIISVDERGQMVLPKELRGKAKIKAGDKLAVTSWEKNGEICCITLIKVEDMVEMVKGQLGPILKEIL